MNMCIIMNMNIYITKQNEEYLRKLTQGSMSGLINGLIDQARTAEDNYQLNTPTPAKPAVKEAPPVIRNLREVIEQEKLEAEMDAEYATKRYDPKNPWLSPFGPLRIEVDPYNPERACDPNVDPDSWIPFDVAKRNAML
jgi:hypothetical protein